MIAYVGQEWNPPPGGFLDSPLFFIIMVIGIAWLWTRRWD
jgi:hypothetical protein